MKSGIHFQRYTPKLGAYEVSVSTKQSANVAAFTPENPVEAIRPVAVIKNANISIALTNEISEGLLSRILLEMAHA